MKVRRVKEKGRSSSLRHKVSEEAVADPLIEEPTSPDNANEQSNQNTLMDGFSDIPLGQLVSMREKLGTKLFNKTISAAQTSSSHADLGDTRPHASRHSSGEEDEAESSVGGGNSEWSRNRVGFKRENRRRPMEMSAKKPVSSFRDVFATEKKIRKEKWDPRFESDSGEYNKRLFQQNYGFLDEIRQQEKEQLIAEMEETKNKRRAGEIKQLLKRMRDKETAEQDAEKKKKMLRKLTKNNTERLKSGKSPIFLKRAELKQIETEDKFAELKQTGKLDKYMKRKSKKEARKKTELVFEDN